jgi:hypothetical protein
MYDSDDPSTLEEDVGENGKSTGYIGASLIYAPPSPSDSVWVADGDTLRMVRPSAHMWWDWEHDPATDEDVYDYLSGYAPIDPDHNILPPPEYVGEGPFDYRFFLATGPFDIADGDTIYVVYGLAVGEGLNGGDENYYYNYQWLPGLRHVIDRIWKEYYRGSEHSDPFHPSSPVEDNHWGQSSKLLGAKSGAKVLTLKLFPVSPNPIKGSASVMLSVPRNSGPIDLLLYDVSGRRVKTILKGEKLTPGYHMITLKATDDRGVPLPSGIYFLMLKNKRRREVQKLLIIR